jgi:hypothetical protein
VTGEAAGEQVRVDHGGDVSTSVIRYINRPTDDRKVSAMVAVKEISWEEASAPGFEHTTRQAFRAAVDQVALRAKATLPECNGRVEKAVAIVLAGDVELLPDGHARVASQCQGTTKYRIVNGTCDCPDFVRAPSS